MTEEKYASDRTFKVGDYSITHKMLLIRSPKGGGFESNIDIHFRGVSFFELPTLMTGLRIVAPQEDEIDRIKRSVTDKFLEEDFHVVESSGKRFVVVAIAQHVLENELDIFETSLTPY